MKKIFSVLFATVVVLCMLSGCSMKKDTYSDEEKQIIEMANQIISSEYDVTVDEDDFSYSVVNRSRKMNVYCWILRKNNRKVLKIL